MWAHSFNKDDVTLIQSMGVRCGLRLATRVRQDKQGVRRRSVDEVWIDGKSTCAAHRRLANFSEHPTSGDEEMNIVKKLILAVAVLAGIHVCGNSRTLTVAQDKPTSSTGMVVRSGENSSDQQMALMHRQIDSMKKQIIAANVTLTDTEATKFWPVYEQYSAELKKITYTKNALINEYAEEYGSLTDEQADSLIRRWLDSDIAVFELRRKYLPIFRKVLSGKVTATFFQVEHRINAMIDLQLTSQLPLMQSQDESAEVQ
jgi:hypothetical protein